MAKGPRYKVPYRRRREGKTNYRKRLRLLSGRKPRIVVRITNRRVIAQYIKYEPDGDRILLSVSSDMLRDYGYLGDLNNTPASYLTGILFGKKCLDSGYSSGILDIGLRVPSRGSRVFAFLKGVVDAGVDVPHSPEVFPDDSRIRGEHIAEYYGQAKDRFGETEKRGFNPQNYPDHVDELRKKILGE